MPGPKTSRIKKELVGGAGRELLEQLFNDHYRYRWRVYEVNFFRGIFFGLGSVIGATIVVAFVVWVLSLFTNIPVVGDIFEKPKDTIQTETNQ